MAIIVADGFDIYRTNVQADIWTYGPFSGYAGYVFRSNYGPATDITRFGVGKAFRFGSDSGSGFYKSGFTTNNTVYLSAALYNEGSGGVQFNWDQGGTTQVKFNINPGGSLTVYRGNNVTLLGTLSGNPTPQLAWTHIQCKVVFHASAGEVRIRLNGNTTDDLALTGINTLNTANAWADAWYCNGSSPTALWDDLILFDSSGASFNTWMGDIRCYTMFPTAAGSASDFASTSGYTGLQTYDGDTSYNSSATVGAHDLFAMGDLPATPTSIYGVIPRIIARKSDAGARTLQTEIKSGSTLSQGTSTVLSTSYLPVTNIHSVDPNTGSAWTASGVNALEVGYKIDS